MLNLTECNNVVICVLPVGVELPTPKTYEEYCKKYATKSVRSVERAVAEYEVTVEVDRVPVLWLADGGEFGGSCTIEDYHYEFMIYRDNRGIVLLVDLDVDCGNYGKCYYGNFEVTNIPSWEEAMSWADNYANSITVDLYGSNNQTPEYKWEEVKDLAKLWAEFLAK